MVTSSRGTSVDVPRPQAKRMLSSLSANQGCRIAFSLTPQGVVVLNISGR